VDSISPPPHEAKKSSQLLLIGGEIIVAYLPGAINHAWKLATASTVALSFSFFRILLIVAWINHGGSLNT
jgi:hypothetical protein